MKLKLGTTLSLELKADKVGKFRCKIVDIDEEYVYIDYPIDTSTGKTAFLIDGAKLRASFVEESKFAFVFETEVVGKRKGKIPMIKLSYPGDSELIKIQRRDFVRVNTSVDISIQFEEVKYQFVTDDISAGGVAVIINKPVNFEAGNDISVLIPLAFNNGDIKYVSANSSVVSIWEKDNKTIASLQFIDADDLDKQLIVRFCFERQLYLRNKGLH